MLKIHSNETSYFQTLILLIRCLDISCPIYRTLGQWGVKLSGIKRMKLSPLDVYSIKFEAPLVVISLFVVDIDTSSLNIEKIVHSFCTIITIHSRKFAEQNANWCLFLSHSETANFMNSLFVLHVLVVLICFIYYLSILIIWYTAHFDIFSTWSSERAKALYVKRYNIFLTKSHRLFLPCLC